MKKIIMLLMAISLYIIAFGTISVSAETYGDLTYSIVDDEVIITDCEQTSKEIEIPSVIDGYPVTCIGASAFKDCSELTSIVLPDSITQMCSRAFYRCSELEKVNISDIDMWYKMKIEDYWASPLYNSSARLYLNGELLTSVTLPDGLTCISKYVFYNCRDLTSITIPESITSIGYATFSGCSSLTSINLPEGLTSIGDEVFEGCSSLTSITIPEGITSIGSRAFFGCKSLTSITIPEGITSIGGRAFSGCKSLTSINLPEGITSLGESAFSNCEGFTSIVIPDSVTNIGPGTFFLCINLKNIKLPDGLQEINSDLFYGCSSLESITLPDGVTKISDGVVDKCSSLKSIILPNSLTYISSFGIRCNLTDVYFNGTYEQWQNIRIGDSNYGLSNAQIHYFSYINIYEKDGSLIFAEMAENGNMLDVSNIPEKIGYSLKLYTDKEITKEFYYKSIVVNQNLDLYIDYVINQYTYKFVDESGKVLKEETVDYGTVIIPPEFNNKPEYYIFERWSGYSEGMVATENVTFNAEFRYKSYSIVVDGLSETLNVTYNSKFNIKPQYIDDYHYFIGYFTEKDGMGRKITNERGESLSVYDVVGDLKVYPYFYEGYINKAKLQGIESAVPGDTIIQSAIFATDMNISYFIATIKHPIYLKFKSIKGVDFKEATKDSEKINDGFNYLDIICVFDYFGNFAEINKNYIPFEIEFEVSTDAPIGNVEISIENVMLIGDDYYDIIDVENHTITILPKLAEQITIDSMTEINDITKISAVIFPSHTTDKSVEWSVDDESVATIAQDGTVTPIKNGKVIITAISKDGSGVYATKIVDIIAYAKINSLDFDGDVILTEFNPNLRKYTVYVKNDSTSISLTPTFSGGVLRPNGSGVWISGRSKDFELKETGTTIITLNRENVTDMTNSVYTVEVVKFVGTKTEVSNDKKIVTITPINIESGKRIILSLYADDKCVEVRTAICEEKAISFIATKAYTMAKVMVWDNLRSLKPVCDVEIVK